MSSEMLSVSSLDNSISNLVRVLLCNGQFGVYLSSARISNGKSSKPNCNVNDPNSIDRFTLKIPYAGNSISWFVLFDCFKSSNPPDFILDPEDKDVDFCPDITTLKALRGWDSASDQSLLHVVEELVEAYRSYQVRQLSFHPVVQHQYVLLVEEAGIAHDHIDVLCLKNKQDEITDINLNIKLEINFTDLPVYMTEDISSDWSAVLLITFNKSDVSHVSTQLHFSSRIENALGLNIKLPRYTKNVNLVSYVEKVTQLIQSKVDLISKGYSKRKEYIHELIDLYPGSIIEYDVEKYNQASFLFEWHDFFFIITVSLSEAFPEECPLFSLLSVYHGLNDTTPFNKMIDDYPYSPRWSAKEMIERVMSSLTKEIRIFQKESVKEGSL